MLLINTAVGAMLAFPAVWLVGRMVGIDLAGLSGGGLRALKVLLAWTLLLFVLRVAFSFALRTDVFVRRVLIVGPDAAAVAPRRRHPHGAPRLLRGRRGAAGRAGARPGRRRQQRQARLGRHPDRRRGRRGAGAAAAARPGARPETLHRQRVLGAPAAPDRRDRRRRGGAADDAAGLDSAAEPGDERSAEARPSGRAGSGPAPAVRHRAQPGHADLHPAADAAGGAGDPARQRRAGALPPGAGRPARAALHAAEVPLHAHRRRGARAGLGGAARSARHPRRRLHPAHPHRRAAATAQHPARRDELHRPAAGAAAFRRRSWSSCCRSTPSAAASSPG